MAKMIAPPPPQSSSGKAPLEGSTPKPAGHWIEGMGWKKWIDDDPSDDYPVYTPGYNPLTMSAVTEMNKLDGQYSQGFNRQRAEALRKGPSNWLNMSLAQDALKQEDAREKAGQMNASRTAEAHNRLASLGGLSSGARERVEEQGQEGFMNMSQDLARSSKLAGLGMGVQDEQNRIGKLSDLTGKEMQRENMWTTAKDKDTANELAEAKRKSDFDMNLFDIRKRAEGAESNANAIQNSGGGGCCFIFLEARYGTGAMDQVVRRYRDEHMTERNKRGYYKLAEVLVPFMRSSRVAKFMVQLTMTTPLVAYGKAYYGRGSKIGLILKPLVSMWLSVFDYLGCDHKFIRENGELI